ncbi:hypothetical protein QVD17_38053 [Tagetes erecta]|uniref:TF-B3 domain-containing protein n=1 Tax=Tagetes erecta TaxID=13708 RepID=A0AAD8JVC0_TARER|nr:hypothetical protein QVD17_38053 [Tagetes erecta]
MPAQSHVYPYHYIIYVSVVSLLWLLPKQTLNFIRQPLLLESIFKDKHSAITVQSKFMEINPGFFKVLRYTSLEHLAIPKRWLMKRYKKENFLYGTVCVRDDMHVWNVKLGRNNDGDVALTKSWINIVQAYGMQPTTLIHFQSFDDETKTFNFQVLNKDFVEAYLGNLHAGDYITVKLNEYDSYRVQLAASQTGLMFGEGCEDISRVCCFIFSSTLFFTFIADGLLELRLYDASDTQVLIPPQHEVSQNQTSHAAAASGSSVQSRSNIQAEEGLTFQIKSENSRLRLPKNITDSASMENQPVLDTWKLKYIDGSLHFGDIKKGNDKSRERYSLIYWDYIREFNGIYVGDQVSFTFFPSKRLLVIDQKGNDKSRERYSLIYWDYIREFNGIYVGDQVSFTFFPSKRLLVID